MAKPYFASITGISAGFPTTLYTARAWLNRASDHDEASETFTVPGVANNYTVELDHQISAVSTLTVRDDTAGADLNLRSYGTALDADEFGVSYELPLIQLHSSLEGHDVTVTYTPIGTPLSVTRMGQIERELAAVEVAAQGGGQIYRSAWISGQPSTSATTAPGVAMIWLSGQGKTSRKLIGIAASTVSGDAGSGSTVLKLSSLSDVSTFAEGTNGVTLTLTTTGAATDYQVSSYNASGLWTIDTTNPLWLYVYCTTNSGLHQDIKLEAIFS